MDRKTVIFIAWLCDVALIVLMALAIVGIWDAPTWFRITLIVLMFLSCGTSFGLFKIGWTVLVMIVLMNIWDAPMWFRIIMAIFALIGIGYELKTLLED